MLADPLLPNAQWWLYGPTTYWDTQTDDGNPVEQPSYGIDAENAWSRSKGAGQIVAVVDTGFDTSLLAGHLWTNPTPDPTNGDLHGWNFGDNSPDISDAVPRGGHGTKVAELVAQAAPAAQLMLLRVVSTAHPDISDAATVARAVDFAIAHRATIINYSFGAQEECTAEDAPLIRKAVAHGILFVVAAGNEGEAVSAAHPHCPPLGLPGELAATAVDQQGDFNEYDNLFNWGDGIQVAAPGEELEIPGIGGDTYESSGTSLAAPLAAGAAALVRADRPQATPQQVIAAIEQSAYPLPALIGKVSSAGIVDAARALDAIENADLTAPTAPALISPASRFSLRRTTRTRFCWTASSDDRALAGYQLTLDGRMLPLVSPTSTCSTVRMRAGIHRWHVAAIDTNGNLSP